MKRLLLFLSILATTSTSFSQTATETLFQNKKDSLVCLPKTVVQFMIQDIIRGDASREEAIKLDSIIFRQEQQLRHADSSAAEWANKKRTYEATIKEFRNIDSTQAANFSLMTTQAKKFKRKRNGWRIFAVFVTGLLIYHTNFR